MNESQSSMEPSVPRIIEETIDQNNFGPRLENQEHSDQYQYSVTTQRREKMKVNAITAPRSPQRDVRITFDNHPFQYSPSQFAMKHLET